MKVVSRSIGIYSGIASILAAISGGLIITLMLVIAYETTARYLFNRPLIWGVQLSEYLLLWITFAGAAWLLNLDGHVSVDFVTSRLRPRTRILFNIMTSILGLLVCAALFYFSAQNTLTCLAAGTMDFRALYIPKALVFSVIPLSSFLLFIGFGIKTGRYIKLHREGRG